jgi:DNA-binding protein Fis
MGDINGDGVVDIYDAILLANAYGSIPGNPRWNPKADLNGDNVVDIYDAIILAKHYG